MYISMNKCGKTKIVLSDVIKLKKIKRFYVIGTTFNNFEKDLILLDDLIQSKKLKIKNTDILYGTYK